MAKWAVRELIHDESKHSTFDLYPVSDDEKSYVEESGGYAVFVFVHDTKDEAIEGLKSLRD